MIQFETDLEETALQKHRTMSTSSNWINSSTLSRRGTIFSWAAFRVPILTRIRCTLSLSSGESIERPSHTWFSGPRSLSGSDRKYLCETRRGRARMAQMLVDVSCPSSTRGLITCLRFHLFVRRMNPWRLKMPSTRNHI